MNTVERENRGHAPAAGDDGGDIDKAPWNDQAELDALIERFIAVAEYENPRAVRERLTRCIRDTLST